MLGKVEPGLRFLNNEKHIPSSVGTKGFIDILAQDNDGRYVLIEVKKTGPATREALHEILKYVEGAKAHLGLREHVLRVIVASVEWRELLIPFSSFVGRTTCHVDGFRLEVDGAGAVIGVEPVEPVVLNAERVLAPWHELSFFEDEAALAAGIAGYEAANAAKGIASYVLVVLDPPAGHFDGFPSTKQIANRAALAEMAAGMGYAAKDIPDTLYRAALYLATQQLSRDEYVDRLSNGAQESEETLASIDGMDDEEALCMLHEAVLDLPPRPVSGFLEIGYPAKFKSRLIEGEGWQIREVRRYGAFARNALLRDETTIDEIGGAQGNARQSVRMHFRPDRKAEMAEVRKRVDACLADNDPWRSQIGFALTELARSGECRECYIQIMNPMSAIATVYLTSQENGFLYVPTYQIRVPGDDTECMYFGAITHNGSTPNTLRQIIDEFYDGSIAQLLRPLLWGGYEARDVRIIRRLGLRYRSFRVDVEGEERRFRKLDGGEWEECASVNPLSSYIGFLHRHSDLTDNVRELYGSRWNGRMVMLERDD